MSAGCLLPPHHLIPRNRAAPTHLCFPSPTIIIAQDYEVVEGGGGEPSQQQQGAYARDVCHRITHCCIHGMPTHPSPFRLAYEMLPSILGWHI
eukprot:1034503-Pelagomonas_calceolata.AAC.1